LQYLAEIKGREAHSSREKERKEGMLVI